MEFVEKVIDKLSNNIPVPDKEYIGEDGLTHCSVCHKATQVRMNLLGKEKLLRCICDCKKKEIADKEQQDKRLEIEKMKSVCFVESNMANWTFEADDRKNEKLSNAMIKYCENFKQFRKEGKGLMLYGNTGTGKTYFAACIANRLIEDGYSVLMTNFMRLTNQIQADFDGRQEFIDGLNKYSLLIIDDLGAERKSEYMQEMVYNIIDSRYRSGLPFIITTNLNADELKKTNDISFQRIYDRIFDRCFPIAVNGLSRRRQNLRDTYEETKELLGL